MIQVYVTSLGSREFLAVTQSDPGLVSQLVPLDLVDDLKLLNATEDTPVTAEFTLKDGSQIAFTRQAAELIGKLLEANAPVKFSA